MFTFAGDPESLYNVPGRPVFDWITGAFFYLGVLICLIRLKRVESGFALAWLVIGIAPAFVSVPAGSFSHTIAALPVVYIIAAIGVVTIVDKMTSRWQRLQASDKMTSRQKIILSSLHLVILSGVLLLNGALTLRDYFGAWANDPFVRFQYHAPTRAMAMVGSNSADQRCVDRHTSLINSTSIRLRCNWTCGGVISLPVGSMLNQR